MLSNRPRVFRHNRLKDIINTSLPDRRCPVRGERPHKSRVVTATECSKSIFYFFGHQRFISAESFLDGLIYWCLLLASPLPTSSSAVFSQNRFLPAFSFLCCFSFIIIIFIIILRSFIWNKQMTSDVNLPEFNLII